MTSQTEIQTNIEKSFVSRVCQNEAKFDADCSGYPLYLDADSQMPPNIICPIPVGWAIASQPATLLLPPWSEERYQNVNTRAQK